VSTVNIDLIGCNKVVEFQDEDNLEQILEKINYLGYGTTVIKLESTSSSSTKDDRLTERTVMIAIDGMYCEHCQSELWKHFSTQ
jgi:Cu+-exporting ATPase